VRWRGIDDLKLSLVGRGPSRWSRSSTRWLRFGAHWAAVTR